MTRDGDSCSPVDTSSTCNDLETRESVFPALGCSDVPSIPSCPVRPGLSADCSARTLTASIGSFLCEWASEHWIPNIALNGLLRQLKQHPCFSSLPCDARTLLGTPRTPKSHRVSPGEYRHFSLRETLRTLILSRNLSELPADIGLTFYVDGLPLSKSTNCQFWPISGSCDVERSVLFLIGCYHGYAKPVYWRVPARVSRGSEITYCRWGMSDGKDILTTH